MNSGGRFSINARTASLASSVENVAIMTGGEVEFDYLLAGELAPPFEIFDTVTGQFGVGGDGLGGRAAFPHNQFIGPQMERFVPAKI